jgi:hypothetical protein
MTAGQLVQKDAQITYSRFDLENECSDMNYLWLNLKGYGNHVDNMYMFLLLMIHNKTCNFRIKSVMHKTL